MPTEERTIEYLDEPPQEQRSIEYLDAPNPVGLPGANRTEQLIANRPSQWQGLIDLAQQFQQRPIQSLMNPINQQVQIPLALMGGAMGSVEAPIANTAMSLQRGKLPTLEDIAKGITGQKPGQLGDVMRSVGTPEPLAAATGLLGMGALGNIGSKGKLGTQVSNVANKGAKQGMQKVTKTIETIKNIPDKFFRGGLTKTEALRVEAEYGGSTGTLAEQVKNKLNNLITQAGNKYKEAIVNFKGNTIQSDQFYRTLQKGLQNKGWIDLQGNPTTRFQSGLDPVMDKLANLYMDLRTTTTKTGQKIAGNIMSKEDFSTYRDALNGMLREKPSDRVVMQAKNALYGSAEKSGMKGITKARDLEREAFKNADKYLDKNGNLKIATEAKLNKIGTKNQPSKQDLQHINELAQYVKHPIIQDATKINKLNAAKESVKRIKESSTKWAIRGAAGGTAAGVGYEAGKKLF